MSSTKWHSKYLNVIWEEHQECTFILRLWSCTPHWLHHAVVIPFDVESLTDKCVPTGTLCWKTWQASCHPLWRALPERDGECFWEETAAEAQNCLQIPRRRLIHLAADVAYGHNARWEFVICYFNKESYKEDLSSHCSKQGSSQVRQINSLKASRQISDLHKRPSQPQPPRHEGGKFSTCANLSLPYVIFLALSVNIFSLLTVSLTVKFPA